ICSMESEEIQSRLLFPHVSELDLSCNKLTSLTPDIGELSNLKILTLRGNSRLRELPPKLGLLKSLWKLELELCPLDGAIQDFLQNSRYPVKDILGFLQSVLEESTVYNSMNLMFVGFHSIGKTSLLLKLCERGRTPQKATHWRDRVNKDEIMRQVTLLSTVGIDINELELEKRTKGPVVFRTWDFGGQKEYYATHQYFLSPRSLYLVVWSIIDGERGVESLLQWLINIQARAPGAPVIIVGTHLDILRDRATRRNFPQDFEESMMMLIQKMFLSNPEPDKSGLPNILAAVNVSCKTGENIRTLIDMIYENAFELKHPRSRTQHLIGQKIPRKYLLLQSIVRELATERLKIEKEPVLNKSKYTLCVQNKMMERGVTFRDVEELEQATRFLHENGVLFHYDDLPLRDLFFLDPQWLCDQLAKVITVKEINNFAQRGVMRLKSLEFLFKSSGQFSTEHIRSYITNLLNKFEVALQFDEDHLLLPSLLPTETELLEMARRKSDVRIPLRKSDKTSVGLPIDVQTPGHAALKSKRSGRCLTDGHPKVLHVGTSVFYTGSHNQQEPMTVASLSVLPRLSLLAVKPTSNPIFSLCRLYFMTYFPSGFWSRLITRVLADGSFYSIVRQLFKLPAELLNHSAEIKALTEKDPEWRCWQTGFELFYFGFEVMRIREVFFSTSSYFCDYSQCRIKCSIDNEWSFLDVLNSKILEITFPTDSLKFFVANKDGPQLQNLDESKPSSIIYREEVATTKLLVKIVEHVDNLLQDWYPDLGEQRFSQNCEGRYLVTRVVPCPQCLHQEVARQRLSQHSLNPWFFLNPDVPDLCMPVVISEPSDPGSSSQERSNGEAVRERSQTMPGSTLDILVYGEPRRRNVVPGNRPRTLTEGQAFIYNRDQSDAEPVVFTWLVERCMLDVLEGVDSVCPMHGSVSPLYLLGPKEGSTRQQFVAPDVAFQDQFRDLLLPTSSYLDIGHCVGKGNFGEVYEGIVHRKEIHLAQRVAVKILFKQAQARSEMKRGFLGSMEHACSAYLTVRQEVSILTKLEHEHIVPLIGLCLRPLALLLDLAPMGALNSKIEELRGQGELLPLFVIKQITVQVAKALAYLHSENIIYRDLKSENVLVWEFPSEVDAHPLSLVDVKLADYGISRTVDVYSFGMFMFEILTCRVPFANVSNPNNLICQGERPSLTVQEAERCPSYMLDLMSLCWSHNPDDRPSMEGVLGICSCTQFCHLQDVVTLGPDVQVYCGCAVTQASGFIHEPDVSSFSDNLSLAGGLSTTQQQSEMSQVWLSSGFHGNNSLEIFTFSHARRVDTYRTISITGAPILAICVYDSLVWCVDSEGLIQIFQSESLAVIHQIQLPIPSMATRGMTSNPGSCPSTILGLHPSPRHQRVMAVCSEGIVCTVEQPLGGLLAGKSVVHAARLCVSVETKEPEGTDGGSEKSARCYCSVLVTTASSCELWIGQGMGQVSVWDVSSGLISYLSHGAKVTSSSSASCAFLVTQLDTGLCRYVWSYNYPGSVIYQWDAVSKTISRKLDCSQIVSTVDSPVLAMAERRDYSMNGVEGKGGQVSCLSAVQRFLYVGTTRGCLLVTDATSLSPLCVFQCHAARDFYLKLVLPVTCDEDRLELEKEAGLTEEEVPVDNDDDGDTEEKTVASSKLAMPAVVTVGKGYSNALKTFHPSLDSGNTPAPDSWMSGEPKSRQPQVDPYANHTFMLTWNAADWDLY
ncbi:leucine-rich repeat serine/threonine-protein kinase, partial [Plakobranchus ocellatus]